MIVAVAVGVVAALAGAAYAQVSTDQADYSPGSIVAISGGNDTNGLPGYMQGHTVSVDATADNGLWEQTCSDAVSADGTWSCTVTLSDDAAIAVGSYHYTATSTDASGNPISETGTFTDLAPHVDPYDSTCSTTTSSFTIGTTVCAKAAGLGSSYSGRIEWWAPSASTATRTTAFSNANGNYSDTYAPSACGTWTLKLFNSGGTLDDSNTFSVTGCSTPAPTVDAGGPYSGNEGSSISLSGASVTPAGAGAAYRWTINYNSNMDTGGSCSFSPSDAVLNPSVTCTDDSNSGYFTLTLSYTDTAHTTAITDTAQLTVRNVAPSFTTGMPAFAATTVNCGSNTVTLNFGYTDPGSNDTQTASIDWGDGTTSNLTAIQTATGSATHTYNSGGPYTATVNVTDDDLGSTGDVSSLNTLTVYYNLSSILQPINDTRNGQPTSLFKYGSTIPVKVEVTDCTLSHPSDLVLKVTWKQGTGQTPPGTTEVVPTSQADLGNTMRFSDPLYVLQLNSKNTTSDSTSGITIFVTIQGTGQVAQADIGFKK